MTIITKPSPVYLLAGRPGSHRKKDSLLAQVLDCGSPAPTVAYIGAASHDNREFFSMIAGHMRDCGAGGVILVPLAGTRANTDKAKAVLETADMVFISGGDVESGMTLLETSGILPFLTQLHDGGKPFFGLSAGSIMLARQWIRWTDSADDTTAGLFPCMGLAPILCDTHGEADDWEELHALLRLTPEGSVGYGIPSGAGLCVTPDNSVTALAGPLHRYVHRNGKVVRLGDLAPGERL